MRRRLFNLATAVSLVFWAALAAIWLIGLSRTLDKATLVTPHVVIGMFSENGPVTFWLITSSNRLGPPWLGHMSYRVDENWFHLQWSTLPITQFGSISAPGWLWVMTTAILPASWITIRKWKRFKSHQCHNCGYNLTGNLSGVCPECGTAVAGNTEVKA